MFEQIHFILIFHVLNVNVRELDPPTHLHQLNENCGDIWYMSGLYIIKLKFLKSFFVISYFCQKKLFFILDMTHPDPCFAQVAPKYNSFQRFYQNFFRTTGWKHKQLILIEYCNIFHWKSAKKAKWMWSNGQNEGQIRSNVVKSTKKLSIALAINFFHILQNENI